MNLRKLLCGLLALCLLLSMAPAALMEEAPVEEVVVDLGEDAIVEEAPVEEEIATVEAVDYSIIGEDDEVDEVEIISNLKVRMSMDSDGITFILPNDGEIWDSIKKATITKSAAKVADLDGATEVEDVTEFTLVPTGEKTGNVKISVTLENTKKTKANTTRVELNVEVYDPSVPTKITVHEDDVDGPKVSELTLDVTDDPVTLFADIFPATADTDVYWKTSKSSVAAIVGNYGQETMVVPVAKGSATITATTNAGNLKAVIKVKVTDKHAPTKIKIEGKTTVKMDDTIELTAVVTPAYWGHEDRVKWSVDKKSIASLSAEYGETVVLTGLKEGTVKVTAKTHNGKKATLKVTVTNPYKPAKIAFAEYDNKEKVFEELYDENETTDPEKPVNTKLNVTVELTDGNGDPITFDPDDNASKRTFADVEWKSSNTKVAVIGKYQDDPDDASMRTITLKGTGKATISAKANGKTVSFQLIVTNSHAPKAIYLFGKSDTAYVNDIVDMKDYFEIIPGQLEPFGKVSVTSHHSSIVEVIGGTQVFCKRAGNCKVDIECGGKKATFTLKIK